MKGWFEIGTYLRALEILRQRAQGNAEFNHNYHSMKSILEQITQSKLLSERDKHRILTEILAAIENTLEST